VNGGAPVDVSADYDGPTLRPDGSYSSFVSYPTGVTLAAGETATISVSFTLAHPLPEVFNPAGGGEAGQPAFNEPGTYSFTCTVIAV